MQANPRTIMGLFEPTQRFIVPIFQRHYVWAEEEQWTPLWDDIMEKIGVRRTSTRVSPHFLGAVILDSVRRTSTRQVSRLVVIDGQQRLTTFQILLVALRDAARAHNQDAVARAIERCLFNQDEELMERPEEEKYKLWPTQVNRAVFREVLAAGSPDLIKERFPIVRRPRRRKPEPRDKLVEAYDFFSSKIFEATLKGRTSLNPYDFLVDLLGVLRDDFTVVEIMLGEDDDSQEIFNSLNARGKPLSQSDLLRSYIFMRAEKQEEDRDRLYDTYWSRFEDQWWDEETRRGNQASSRLDVLTRTLLSSKLGQPIDVKRVHSAYTAWIDEHRPYSCLEDELRDFVCYGQHFEQLNGRAVGPLTEFGRRMQLWETTTTAPLAIFLAAECSLSAEGLRRALGLIESLIVRRAICGLTTKEYNKLFVDVVRQLRDGEGTQSRLIDVLNEWEGDSRKFPDNREFSEKWRTAPLYQHMKSSQLTFLFTRLEELARSERAEETRIPGLAVEHVMPQEWTEHYPLNGEMIPAQFNKDWYYGWGESGNLSSEAYERVKPQVVRRRLLVQTIGNLTAVTGSLNSAMRNAPFRDKKGYFRESVLALNRYFECFDEWSEKEIEWRSDELFKLGCRLWPSLSDDG